jgi:hypothetical protein
VIPEDYKDINKKRSRIIPGFLIFSIFIISFYYAPILLLWFEIIPFEFRFHILLAVTLLSAVYVFFRCHSLRDLGIRFDNVKAALFLNSILILSVVVIFAALYHPKDIIDFIVPEWSWFNAFYILISAPSQEFLFRSVLFAELKKIDVGSEFAKIGFTSVTYCFLHIIYNDLTTLIVTLLMGIIWGAIYKVTNNFWGVAFSHAILGAISISIGLI